MRILLDIDGVLVPAQAWKVPEIMEDGFPRFSAQAVAALQRLLTEDCTVILTTSHKSNYSVGEWKQLFFNRGMRPGRLDVLPPNFDRLDRKAEIMNWLGENVSGEPFIIIDDDKGLNELPEGLKTFLIQPASHIGLTDRDVEVAVKMAGRR